MTVEFWALAAALALGAALWLIRPLLQARPAAASRAAHDVAVFRDQLAAVDRDLARGALSPAEADGARAEVSRRLLAAAAEAERSAADRPAPRAASRIAAIAAAALMLGGGAGLYAVLGAPGAQDMPLAKRMEDIRRTAAERPSQDVAEAQIAAERGDAPRPPLPPEAERMLDLIDRLRGVLADRPDDVRGRRLLAQALMRIEEPAEAWRALDEAIAIQGGAAPAEDLALAGEAMVLAAQGYVSPEAEKHLRDALRKDPANTTARYYAGLSLAQNGRPDLALELWTGLLRDGPADAPWKAPILSMIEGVAEEAGQDVPQIAFDAADALRAARAGAAGAAGADAPRGPSAADVEATRDMTAEDRRAMIEGMVAGLENTLATEGGAPARWAQLLRAYGALGRPADVERILASAREAFAAAPADVLEGIEQAGAAALSLAQAGGAPGMGPDAPAEGTE